MDPPDWNPSSDEGDVGTHQAALAEILARVSHEALQGDSLAAVLQRIVDCIVQCLPVSVASIIVLNAACTHFVDEVCAGQVALVWPDAEPWPISKGVAGRCVRTGLAQRVNNPPADPDYVMGNRNIQSEYLVPIRHRGRLHGVLNLESVRRDLFTPAACRVFDAIAGQIGGAIHAARLVDELEQANRVLRELSMVDGLTGIANRRCLDERLAAEIGRHIRHGRPLALLMVDVDHFKLLNDAHGHLCGDECLRKLAQLCTQRVRAGGDVVARYGGEELVLLLLDCSLADARQVAEQLRAGVCALGLAHPTSPVADHVTVSIGVAAVYPLAGLTAEVLLAAADAAMYEAKHNGRDRVVACDLGRSAG